MQIIPSMAVLICLFTENVSVSLKLIAKISINFGGLCQIFQKLLGNSLKGFGADKFAETSNCFGYITQTALFKNENCARRSKLHECVNYFKKLM